MAVQSKNNVGESSIIGLGHFEWHVGRGRMFWFLSKSLNNHREVLVHIKVAQLHTEFIVSGSRLEVCSAGSILCVQSESELDHSVSSACCKANHYSYLNLSGFAGGICPVLGEFPQATAQGYFFF